MKYGTYVSGDMGRMKEEFMKLREKESMDDFKDEEYFIEKQKTDKPNGNDKDSKNNPDDLQERMGQPKGR